MIKVFIDDERFPPSDGHPWIIIRTLQQFKHLVETKGFPDFISFDHDLGENEPTGFNIVQYIVETDLDKNNIPAHFTWYTHSQNPIGKINIDCLLKSYLEFKNS